jgi:hypothetical protein
MKRIHASAVKLSLALCMLAGRCDAADNLRVIEFKGPGESASVDIPAGNIFTFGLFAPDKAAPDSVAGVVTYAEPNPLVHEAKMGETGDSYVGTFLGPAKVKVKTSAAAFVRMQLYTQTLPTGVVAGILSTKRPTASLVIPAGSLLTPLFRFNADYGNSSTGKAVPDSVDKFQHYLTVKSSSGAVYGMNRTVNSWGTNFSGFPSLRGDAYLFKLAPDGSSVVTTHGPDEMDAVVPTNNFVGPGTATFSLPSTGRKTEIAFYCYRLTPAKTLPALGK